MSQKRIGPATVAAAGEAREHGAALTDKSTRTGRLTKRGRILRALYLGESLTRLDAWKRHGDACLPSTISELQARYGVTIARRTERVEGRFSAAHVARYWLAPTEREAAQCALAAELCRAGLYRTVGEALEALREGAAA